MTRGFTVKCPVCSAVLRTKRLGEMPRHSRHGSYSRKTKCSGSRRTVA